MGTETTRTPAFRSAQKALLCGGFALVLLILAVRSIWRAKGGAGAMLDDSYIHFQYARAIAEGHPLRFFKGGPISTGATSFLWPLALSPFYLVGFHGEAILYPAWLLSFASLALLALETYELTKPLTGRPAAIGASAMVLSFGGFLWGAASGMEVVPFAWLIARACTKSSAYAESEANQRAPLQRELLLLSWAIPFMRPEGALFSILIGASFALYPSRPIWRERAKGALPLLGVAFIPLLLLALTHHATTSTAQVKLISSSPYLPLVSTTLANVRILLGTILNGEVWSPEFLPTGGAPFFCAGLLCVAFLGGSKGHHFRAVSVLLLALAMLAPCTYVTMLWNRLRYLWPFATGWFIGLACFARVVGDIASRFFARSHLATPILSGMFAGALLTKADGVLDDIGECAKEISLQQVLLGKWADTALPQDALIGVNDTGAIAYFGNRKTFDIVGLTTPSEGRYWVAGPASRLEHYERLFATDRTLLPTHFITYPTWLGLPSIVGKQLFEASVPESTILGEHTMFVHEADYSLLGSGERPWSRVGDVLDEVDVADLESEREHAYQLFGAAEGEQIPHEGHSDLGEPILDGGRSNRTHEQFVLNFPQDVPILLVARVAANAETLLHLRLNGLELASAAAPVGAWGEIYFHATFKASGKTTVDVVSDGARFSSFHYWLAHDAQTEKVVP